MTRVITYGTFDLFHIGHLKILERLASLGDELYVGVSTDEFNATKGKRSLISYAQRAEIVGALKCVTKVIPECDWGQKRRDVEKYGIDIFGMGHDWTGKFDDLADICQVVYLPRTEGISSTQIRSTLAPLASSRIHELKHALDLVTEIVDELAPLRTAHAAVADDIHPGVQVAPVDLRSVGGGFTPVANSQQSRGVAAATGARG